MTDGRVVISSEPSLGPDEVAHRGFSSSFRGFDPNEVRAYLRKVAEDVRNLRDRERELRKSLEDALHAASHPPPPDEATLTAALGEEAGRVLQTAKEAAADIRTKAEDKAGRLLRESEEKSARLLREAEERAARLRGEAETVMGERSEEAEKAAAAIRRAAEAEADAIRAQAQAAVNEEIEAAKSRGREMVGEAQALRERVLADLVRRRSLARVQIEQLRAGKERLIEAYRVVRRTLDEATEELSVVESEARVAADSAARRAASAPEGSVDDLEADLSTARRAELPLLEPSSTWTPRRPEPEPELEPEPEPKPEPVGEFAAASEPTAPAPPPLVSLPSPVLSPPPPPPDPPPPDPVVRVLQAFDVGAVADPVVEEAHEVEEVEEVHETETENAADDGGVEGLFARIKADRADAVAKARAVLDETADLAAAASPPNGSQNGSVNATDVDESMLQRRDEMLDPLEEQLTRRLKRALQDEQNELLDAMRVASAGAVAGLVPDEDTHGRRYAAAAHPLVLDALRAGASFVNPAAPCPDGLDDEVTGLVAALVDELATPLRIRLEAALAEGDENDEAQRAVERLGAAYRQWKLDKIGPVARHHVAAAFSRGVFVASGDDLLRWIVDDDGVPCPDCEDNALAGATRTGAAYPTGQLHPPAHPGCRCVLVPE